MRTLAVRLLSLVTFVVLARFLSPHDYGVAALATVFGAIVALFAAGGLSQTIVQRPVVRPEELDSAFWGAAFIGVLLCVTQVLLARPVASFFAVPELALVLVVMAPSYLAMALASVQAGLLQRELAFAQTVRVAVVSNVVATVLGLTLAVLGAGYWSIVAQIVAVPVITAVWFWKLSSFRPRFRFSVRHFLEMNRVSRHFMGERLADFASNQSDKFLIGRFYGPGVLGLYTISFRVVFIALDVLSESFRIAIFPVFSALQGDTSRLRHTYLLAARLLLAVGLPAFAFLAVNADELLRVAFGAQWVSAAPAVRVLSIYGALQILISLSTALLQALGETRSVFWTAASGSALQVVAMVVVLPFGVLAVAGCFSLRALVVLPVLLFHLKRVGVDHLLFPLLRATLAPAFGAVAVCAVTLLLRQGADWADPALLAASFGGSLLLYVLILAALGRQHVRDLASFVALVRRRSSP